MLPNKFVDLDNVRKDLGCHLICLPHLTDEVTEAQGREVKFPKEIVSM
jgi:hypothetical protein